MSGLTYPATPGFKDDGAGKEAAIKHAPHAKRRREQVLSGLVNGPATAEQIGEAIDLHWYLVRPRLAEAKVLGLITKTGERGRGAFGGSVTQWRLTTEAERAAFNAARENA